MLLQTLVSKGREGRLTNCGFSYDFWEEAWLINVYENLLWVLSGSKDNIFLYREVAFSQKNFVLKGKNSGMTRSFK